MRRFVAVLALVAVPLLVVGAAAPAAQDPAPTPSAAGPRSRKPEIAGGLETRARAKARARREAAPAAAPGPAAPVEVELLPPPAALPEAATRAKVVAVVDGDTIVVEIAEEGDPEAGETRTVRLLGIDAPGVHGPEGLPACFGPEAAERFRVMLPPGRTVHVERDGEDADAAGRLLRHVWFQGRDDGKPYLATEVLVREGFALVVPPSPAVLHLDRLLAAEEAAIAQRLGLWSACQPVRVTDPPVAPAVADARP